MGHNMFTEERLEAIMQCLLQDGKVKVKLLSRKFQVSEDCIRKDLKILENTGQLKRTYGGAILSQDYPFNRDVINRRSSNIEKNVIIAKKVVDLIGDNETIFLDISTTNIKVAELLVEHKKQVIVVTNMIDILQILAKSSFVIPIATGGIMYRRINGFIGAATIEVIKQYSFHHAFLGTCGIDMTDCSITTLGVEDGLTKKAIIHNSRHNYLVMENDKFYFNDSYKFAYLDEINGIITNITPDKDIVDALNAAGVALL